MMDGMRRYDLHLHSDRSDGQHPPDEVLRRCARGELDVIAITDHDIAPSVAPGLHRVEGREIRVIAGVEASGMHDGVELHFLVYFRDAVPEGFRAFCRRQVAARVDRYEAAIRALGLPLPPPDDAARNGERALTRHHLARALVAGGWAKDLRDAFTRFVGNGTTAVPTMPTSAATVIATAREHGGLVSWAHPSRDQADRWLEALVRLGLTGVEGLRPPLTSADRRLFRQAAKRHGLFVTGGSDWHGWYDLDPGLFAAERDQVAEFVDRLAMAPAPG